MRCPECEVISVCGDDRFFRDWHNRVVQAVRKRGHEFVGRGERVDEMLFGGHRRADQLPGFDIRGAPMRGFAVHFTLQRVEQPGELIRSQSRNPASG